MLLHELAKNTGLTKKAIEYYIEQGLISPAVSENGYRDFSKADEEQCHKISVLRRLSIGTEEIKAVLADDSTEVLQRLSVQKQLHVQREAVKKSILDQLSCGKPYAEVNAQLMALDANKTISEKLLEAFPGYYGRYICLHFSRFLNDPIRTQEQQAAYETILSFLDNVPALTFPKEIEEYLEECTQEISTEHITTMLAQYQKNMENFDDFLLQNKEMLKEYLAFQQSEEYKNSPYGKFQALMKEFNNTSGYYDIFIPALVKLSDSYAAYSAQLQLANEKFLAQLEQI